MAFDVITPFKLGQSAIGADVSTLYTVPSETRALLKEFNIANTTGGAVNVRVFLVPSSASADVANAFLYDVSIAANGVYRYNGVQVLNAGDTIQVQASAVGLTIMASGAQAT